MIEYQNGIHLKGTELWFDSKKKVGLSFISNANIDKFTPPEKILATPETIKFLEKKIKKPVVLACPYYRPFALGNLQVELVPSGTMLGSSQIMVDKGDKTLLYSGNINLKRLPTTEPAYTKHCDVLVMKCPFGLPEYKFPSFDKSISELMKFVNEALSSDLTPMLVVEPLGKAQDIIKSLDGKGFKLSLEKTIYKSTKVYEDLGVRFGEYDLFKPSDTEGGVVIVPPREVEAGDIKQIEKRRTLLLTECTDEEKPGIKSQLKVDEVITLCNHADFNDLIKFVDLVDPEKVYLIEENATVFAETLKEKGYETISLEKPTQLNLL